MGEQKINSLPTFKLGDYVHIRHSGRRRGRIVELRGPLGPDGAQIYRVRFLEPKAIKTRKWKPTYVEVREDQLRPIIIKAKKAPAQ